MKTKIQSKVIEIKSVTGSTYLIRLERNGFEFKAGQYLVLSVPGDRKAREYSIYSSEQDPYIDLLIKEVDPGGEVSKALRHLKIGTAVQIAGPFGFFIVKDEVIEKKQPIVFVATGTGISPFRSIIRSNPELNYKIIHGVRTADEAYHVEEYPQDNFVLCTSRDEKGDYNCRVTDYLKDHPVDKNALYYLCGNSAMVDQVTDFLEENNLPLEQIKTEIFF